MITFNILFPHDGHVTDMSHLSITHLCHLSQTCHLTRTVCLSKKTVTQTVQAENCGVHSTQSLNNNCLKHNVTSADIARNMVIVRTFSSFCKTRGVNSIRVYLELLCKPPDIFIWGQCSHRSFSVTFSHMFLCQITWHVSFLTVKFFK